MIKKHFLYYIIIIALLLIVVPSFASNSKDILVGGEQPGRNTSIGLSSDKFELSDLPISDKEENSKVKFRVDIIPRCMFGDIEAITIELTRSKHPRLLLTLEPILPNQIDIQPQVVNLTNDYSTLLKGEYRTDLLLPSITGEHFQALGVYICTDSSKSGRCNDKLAETSTEIFSRYIYGSTLPINYQPQDKIYYFNFILIENKKFKFYKEAFNELRYQQLLLYLTNTQTYFSTTDLYSKIQALTHTISSIPLSIEEENLVISLPRLDQNKCGF